ncbi:hypothetical protein D0859_13917, partial [Hortaea werneckii]
SGLISGQSNCLSETLFEGVFKQTRELDDYLARTDRIIGPLYGLPVSVKDRFDVKGVDTPLGYVGRLFKSAEQDAAMVTVLSRFGAVIITKTAFSQRIFRDITIVSQPFSDLPTSGTRLELLSVASQLISVVRISRQEILQEASLPAVLSGLSELKPSSIRFPYSGAPVSHEGQSHVPSSAGTLARELSTLTIVTKECLLTAPWNLDPTVTPLPWREDVYQTVQQRPLKIGIIFDDGVVKPHPEI